MSCFSCCEEDDIHKASDTGPYVANNSAGNSVPHFVVHRKFATFSLSSSVYWPIWREYEQLVL